MVVNPVTEAASPEPDDGPYRRQHSQDDPSRRWMTDHPQDGARAAEDVRVVARIGDGLTAVGSSGGAGCRIRHSGRTLFLHGELDLAARPLLVAAGGDLTDYCTSERGRATSIRPGRVTSAVAADDDAPGADPIRAGCAVVDVARLEFIDAAGLGALVTVHNMLADERIQLCTIHPSTQLRRLSAICRLDHILGLPAVHLDHHDPGRPARSIVRVESVVSQGAPDARATTQPERAAGTVT